MLVAQAKKSSEIFTDSTIPDSMIDIIYNKLDASMKNIVLIGMPGAGKSSVANALSEITGRKSIDSDNEIYIRSGYTPKQLILDKGEPAFREIENEVIKDLGKQSGLIIATGGGVVTVEDNYNALHQNGNIVWLVRDIDKLDDTDRPLSQQHGADFLFAQREPLYRRFADHIVKNEEDVQTVAQMIVSMIESSR